MNERVVIDKAGRIVIPKSVRERLGFEAGDLVVLETEGRDLVVRAEQTKAGLVERDGLLFKPRDRKAGVLDPEDVNRLIETVRDPRARAGKPRRSRNTLRKRQRKSA